MTRVLLVGSGAREHAMAAAIARSKDAQLLAVMKHGNPGIAALATATFIHDELDIDAIVEWAREQEAGLAVIGPEAPEEKGLADALGDGGIACASPTKAAARLETDKSFMRGLMESHAVPGRLAFHRFDREKDALAFLDEQGPKWAIKPVGLTGGKGVQVFGDHFMDLDGAKEYVRHVFASKTGGGALQFEDLAVGEEFTLMALTDGKTVLPMVAVQDHKRLYEGDKGPNTGGMGSYSQADGLLPFLTQSEYDAAVEIIEGVVAALAAEGTPYRGAIYGQFMLTPHGPKVIEFNARFGDPEAMNVLQLLETDYVLLLSSIVAGKLHNMRLAFRQNATVVKYMVPKGYGDGKPRAGVEVVIDEAALAESGATLYYGAVELGKDGALRTLTSRTLAVAGEAETISEAERIAEEGVAAVDGEGLAVRHDIGTSPLVGSRIRHMQELRAQAARQEKAAARPPEPPAGKPAARKR